jgi:hypothetical protein
MLLSVTLYARKHHCMLLNAGVKIALLVVVGAAVKTTD